MSTIPRLIYKNHSAAPGYRDLKLKLADPVTGKEYEVDLRPADVETLIFACAEVTRQIGDHPPIDWDAHRAQIVWPSVTPWKVGNK